MTEIQKLYLLIPKTECSHDCVKCCKNSVVQFADEELERAGGSYNFTDRCPFLDDKGDGHGCGIYENRPLVCRIFGASELLPCDGCKCEKPLNAEETTSLLRRYNELRKNQDAK